MAAETRKMAILTDREVGDLIGYYAKRRSIGT